MFIFQFALVIATIVLGILYGPQFLRWVHNENAGTTPYRYEGGREYDYRGHID